MILALALGQLRWLGMWFFFVPVTLIAVIWPAIGSIPLLIAAYLFLPMALPPALTRFELTLPVHARVVLQARLVTTGALVGLPLLLWLISLLMQRPEIVPLAWQLGVLPAIAMAITIAYLTPATRERESRMSAAVAVRLQVAASFVFCAGVVYLLPALVALALLGVSSVVLYLLLVRRVPAMLLLEQSGEGFGNGSERNVEHETSRFRPVSDQRLLRLLLNPKWFSSLFLALATAFLVWSGPQVLGVFVLLNVSLIAEQRKRLRWLSSLPVSHRQRLWLEIGPTVIPLCIGAVMGLGFRELDSAALNTVSSNGQHTKTPDEWYGSPTRTSLVYWARAPRNTQPLITSPWGESVQADTLTLFNITRYNPYTTRKVSSERFVDWQFLRASETVYGRGYSLSEYQALPQSEHPGLLSRQPRGQLYLLSVLATGILLIYWLPTALQSHRLKDGLDPELAASSVWLLVIAPFLLVIWLEIIRDVDPVAVLGEALVLYCLRVLPDSWPLTLLITVVPVFAAYRVLEWQFARTELGRDTIATAVSARRYAS